MSMSEEELAQAFPGLAERFQQPGNGNSNPDLPPYNPNVTDADVEAYIQRNGGVVGPKPEVSGQPARAPQFQSGQGQHQPPPGGMEGGPEGFPPPPPQPPAGEPGAGVPGGEPAPTTPPPGYDPSAAPPYDPTQAAPPGAPPAPPTEFEVDGQQIPVERVRAFQTLYERIQGDPNLQQVLQDYLTRPPGQPAQPAQPGPYAYQPGPYGPGQPGFEPAIPPLDYSDPIVQSLAPAFAQQQQQIQQLQQMQQQQQQFWQQEQARANAAAVEQAQSQFKAQHQLDDGDMAKIRRAAGDTVNIDNLMRQGLDVTAAVTRAFDVAMSSFPEFRQREYARWLEGQRQQAQHRQRLAGVGGASGSVPRQPAPPQTPAQSRDRMMQEVGEMLSGNWSEPGS